MKKRKRGESKIKNKTDKNYRNCRKQKLKTVHSVVFLVCYRFTHLKMSGEPLSHHEEELNEDLESTTSWSLSAISAASGFDPEQCTKELGSPNDEISTLVSNVEDLRKSLQTIREKSTTPLNSPRQSDGKGPSTPSTILKKPQANAQTPPVKDSGPGAGSEYKLEHMRKVLRDLEESKNQYQLNRSKIPRRSLNFNGKVDDPPQHSKRKDSLQNVSKK